MRARESLERNLLLCGPLNGAAESKCPFDGSEGHFCGLTEDSLSPMKEESFHLAFWAQREGVRGERADVATVLRAYKQRRVRLPGQHFLSGSLTGSGQTLRGWHGGARDVMCGSTPAPCCQRRQGQQK